MVNHFLQSQEWENFQKEVGREIFRVDGSLIIKFSLALGKSYLYSAGCLTFDVKQVADLAKKENVVFLKIEPMSESARIRESLLDAGFVKSSKDVQPQKTIVLDLTKSEEELLREMHHKSRYNIRLAEKHGIKFSIFQKFEDFWGLMEKTSKRDKFSSHPKEYYKKLLELSFAKLFIAEHRGNAIAANIVIFYGDRATYLHGASDYKYRNLMAPYLLHWETIKYAKEKGFKEYDLWGIDEKKWPGLTRFKRGFGGREVEYIGSYDYVLQPFWYGLYNVRRSLVGG